MGAPMTYREIKAVVMSRMKDGTWPPDEVLPSEAALVEEFSSTRTTVNRALRELAEEGYLERRRKAGTRVRAAPIRKAQFVIPLVRDEVEASGAAYSYARGVRRVEAATEALAARLGLVAGAEVLHLTARHFADGRPYQYERRWIVLEQVPQARDEAFEAEGPNAWLVRHVPLTNLELSFSAVAAEADLAEQLGAAAGTPVFATERLTWLEGEPVTFAQLYFAPGYRMTTSL